MITTKTEQPKGWVPGNLAGVPASHGVYILRDQHQNILFIGSHRLRERLISHLRTNDIPGVRYFEWYQTSSLRTAKETEQHWIARYRPPFVRRPGSAAAKNF